MYTNKEDTIRHLFKITLENKTTKYFKNILEKTKEYMVLDPN